MAEDEAPSPSPSFLEVKCNSSGKTRRFALGTEAGFAVSVINRKLGMGMEVGLPLALYIEATREGHEPITFGPNSTLVNFGDSWILHTVTDLDSSGIGHVENVVRSERSPVSKESLSEYPYLGAYLNSFLNDNFHNQQMIKALLRFTILPIPSP
ncbi:hypothetical protein CsatA_012927 [Cannabis sativa]